MGDGWFEPWKKKKKDVSISWALEFLENNILVRVCLDTVYFAETDNLLLKVL